MKTISMLAKRNILVYIKDKATVFFSLLSVFITLGLYIIFLGETNIVAILGIVPIERETAAYLINTWVMAGIIIINSVTVTLGVLGIMVEDGSFLDSSHK